MVESADSPVIRLVDAVLISAIKAHASMIRIERSVVTFTIGGTECEEMRLPEGIHAAVVRRLSVMASLPTYARGQAAEGRIHLRIGDDREMYFALRVAGHGDDLRATLVLLKPEDLQPLERL
jgi:type II secretory ATPase GspE/PulE/Tfp pilus assembly ATPase PilB-like protein